SPQLAKFLADESEYVVTNAARAINDDELVKDALPSLAGLLDQPRFTNEPLLRRAINANIYAKNSKENAMRLIRLAQQQTISGTLRAEAIQTLAVWSNASVYDRVSGMYRGPLSHPQSQAVAALKMGAKNLLTDKSSEVRKASIAALGELNLQDANDQLIAMLNNDTDAEVRTAALQTLKKFNHARIGELVFTALKDKEQSVRMAGLAMVPDLNMPVDQTVAMHRLLIEGGTPGEQQAALLSLANVEAAEAEALFREQLQLLIEGKIALEVQLELITAVEKLDSPALKKLLADYEAGKDSNNPLDVYRESIYGGDPQKGLVLFRYSNSTQCVR